MTIRRQIIKAVLPLLLSVVGGWLSPAYADGYPTRPITLVIPFAPGGATDIVGRMLAQELTTSLGQSVVVVNQAGAGGVVGAGNVARAPADGYTLLLSSLSTLGISAPQLSYSPLRDFSHISMVAYAPNVLVVHPSLPVKSVKDLIALARSKPGDITYGTGGAGTSVDLAAALFAKMAHVQLERVAYRGSGPALLDLIAGRINLMFDNMPSAMPSVADGKLRAIAVTAKTRAPAHPELPTMAEAGLPGYELLAWFGVSAPANTSPEIVMTLANAIENIGRSSKFQERLATVGAEVKTSSPGDFTKFYVGEIEKYQPFAATAPQ